MRANLVRLVVILACPATIFGSAASGYAAASEPRGQENQTNSAPKAIQSSSQISAQMLFRQAPVPNDQSKKDLRFFADMPGDSIVTVQRPSFTFVDPSKALLSKEMIAKSYRKKLGEKQGEQILASGYRVFGNFVDGLKGKAAFEAFKPTDASELWQLVLPNRTTVDEAIFQMEWFRSSIGGHAQIRFKLSNPLLLISQDTGKTKFVEGDIVYALMALRTQNGNQNWDAVTGLTGAFASSYMLATAEHMAHRQLRKDDSSLVEQYRLNISEQQKQNLLSYALQVGPRVGEKEIYNLIYNSCVNAALRALKTIDNRVDAWEFNPYQVLPQLLSLGIIKEGLQSANDEFKSPVRLLEDATNEKTLETVEKLQDVMATKTFEETIRTFAATVIEDRWTTTELNIALNTVTATVASMKTTNPVELAQVGQILLARLKIRLANSPNSSALPAKSQASVDRLMKDLTAVLQRNQLELPELMAYLKQASLTAR